MNKILTVTVGTDSFIRIEQIKEGFYVDIFSSVHGMVSGYLIEDFYPEDEPSDLRLLEAALDQFRSTLEN